MHKYPEFDAIYRYLCEQITNTEANEYWVPEILVGGSSFHELVNVGNPFQFYSHIFEEIASRSSCGTSPNKDISVRDCVYQAYIRTFAALNGEIGTALKQIAFLPFLKDQLGITIFISLPSGVIGKTNRKGMRGSPFAVKNPFEIDSSLGDSLLPCFSAKMQYKAMIQACHLLGIRPGSIVPLTTLSMDNPLFKTFPSLGFWWLAEPNELLFPRDQNRVQSAESVVQSHSAIDIRNEDKQRFVEPPHSHQVEQLRHNNHDYYIANIKRKGHPLRAVIANAFPDPIVRSPEKYTWRDVATVRYTADPFPPKQGEQNIQALDKSQPAWRIMPHIISWRALELGEEVFLIDVNQCVPEAILSHAKLLINHWEGDYESIIEPLFAENVSLEKAQEIYEMLDLPKNISSQPSRMRSVDFIGEELWSFELDGDIVTAIVGPLIFCVSAHSSNHETLVGSLRYHLKQLETSITDKLYFGGVANHDTIPPDPKVSPLLYAMYHFLPRCIPMVFSGNEFHAKVIVNKEFGFSSKELMALQAELKDTDLALFNDVPLDWSAQKTSRSSSSIQIISLLQTLRQIREQLFDLASDEELAFRFLNFSDKSLCFGYQRILKGSPNDSIFVFSNWHQTVSASLKWQWPCATVLCTLGVNMESRILTPNDKIVLPPHSIAVIATGKFQTHLTYTF